MPNFEIMSQISELAYQVDENLRFPESEALVPLNPHKIGPYMAGAALAIDTPDPIDRLSVISENLQAAAVVLLNQAIHQSQTEKIYCPSFIF